MVVMLCSWKGTKEQAESNGRISQLNHLHVDCQEPGISFGPMLISYTIFNFYLYNKSGYVCLSVCLFSIAGQTAGPIETKLDTRTHVHPGSVSGKVNVNVIHVCLREWQKYETPGMRHLANEITVTRRGAAGGEQRTAQPRAELRPEDG